MILLQPRYPVTEMRFVTRPILTVSLSRSAFHPCILPRYILRSLKGIIHEWLLSARHRSSWLQESSIKDRRPNYLEPALYESWLSSARVSKIFHMGVPGGIEQGGHGADDEASWHERYNSKGPEWRAPGNGETLQNNANGKRPVVGGNTFVVVEAEGGDQVHSDGKTALKAAELLGKFAKQDKPFFLGVGFVRPHVPFVAPQKYYKPFLPYSKMKLPPKVDGDWDDIPKPGINYCTSVNMKMDIRKQKKAVGGYYASVAFLDAQVGKVMKALKDSGQADRTIVIFTSDHGFHLGEHDFWAKVSLLDESSQVPLIISVPEA